MTKSILTGLVVGLVAAILTFVFLNSSAPLGASSGNEPLNTYYFRGGLFSNSFGSGVLALGTGTTTMTAAQFCGDYNVMSLISTGEPNTLTFPQATSTIATCNSVIGGYKEILFRNTGTATTTIAFTAGSGMTLQTPSSTATAVIVGGQSAVIKFWVLSATAIEANMEEPSN